jgi:hypothetical protein
LRQAEDKRTEIMVRITELETIRASLEEALGHAQRAYPPRGARRIELLIHAALRETEVQIENPERSSSAMVVRSSTGSLQEGSERPWWKRAFGG